MAKMSNSLVKQFAKTITQSVPQEKSKSSNALGTLVKEGDIFYAMLDGSTFLTPVSMSMSGEEGDRVLVTIQNHSAIVTSNITAPGATTKYVERVEADLTTFKDVTVKNLLANYIRTDELEAKVGTFGYLKVETAEATYLKTVELEAKVGTFGYLKSEQLESEVAKFGYLKTGELAADVAKLGYLKVTDAEATYLKVDELEGKVGTFGYLKVSELEGAVGKFGYLTADQASLKYAQIDFANVTGQVVGTSLIKDGAITDAKILGLSANKITAGILDAAKITVTNLNADNITVGTLNGKLIGTGSVDLNKLAEEVPTKEYLDSVQNGLQGQIDKSIQTYTVTAIPLLNNEPAQGWATEEYQKHVGDICYVVNPGGQADGYTYRFEKDGDTYGWSLIKDSQVTEALQKLLNVDGDLSGLKSFQSETSSWITKTDSELSSVKSRTTTIETTYSTKAEAKNLAEDAKNGAIDEAAKDATSKANQAKTDAINTAASDATSKANSAKSEAISAAASDATSKANSALDNAKKYADDAVDGIEIGGRNLLQQYIKAGGATTKIDDLTIKVGTAQNDTWFFLKPWEKLEKGETYTISCIASNVPDGCKWSFGVQNQSASFQLIIDKNGKCSATGVMNESVGADAEMIIDDLNGRPTVAPNIVLTKFKLEKGTKATDWTPAPEDIDQALSTKVESTTFNEVKQTVDTNSAQITQMTKTLEQKADGSSVESLQQTINTVQQTANENVSKISQVTQSVEKAQSAANTAKERIETISQTVNDVKQTADSNSAQITQMNQTVAQKADGSKVTKLEERTSSVEQNLSGFKSEVSSTYTTKTEFENLESTYNSYVQQTDSKIAAKLESSTFNSFQNGEYSNFKKSTNEFIGTSEAWEMRWNKIFNSDNAAENTYQSYITFQNGEQILGNSKSNIKLHLKNDVIQFEDSNGNALASFDAANIYLGKNSKESIIDLCNSSGKIAGYTSDYGDIGIELSGPHYVNLFTEGVSVNSDRANKSSALLMGDEYVDIFLNDGSGGWSSKISLEGTTIKLLGDQIVVLSSVIKVGLTEYREDRIELYGPWPYIDFHYGNSTADYTSRIFENSSGNLNINGVDFRYNTLYSSNWFRSTGNSGWYNENYGGGIFMEDTTWVKVFGGKAFYAPGEIRSDNHMTVNGLGSFGQFRALCGNYGFMIRNDGVNTYFLVTNAGDPWGGWANRFPLTIDNASGTVTIGNGCSLHAQGGARICGNGGHNSQATMSSGGNWVCMNRAGNDGTYHGNLGSGTNYWNGVYYKSLNKVSDKRKKRNLGMLNLDETLILLKNTKTVKYSMLDDSEDMIQYGVFAQDVRDMLIVNNMGYRTMLNISRMDGSEEITTNLYESEDDVTYSVDYLQFIAPLIKGWQYHNDELSTLKREYQSLQGQYQSIQGQIEALRNKLHELEMAM